MCLTYIITEIKSNFCQWENHFNSSKRRIWSSKSINVLGLVVIFTKINTVWHHAKRIQWDGDRFWSLSNISGVLHTVYQNTISSVQLFGSRIDYHWRVGHPFENKSATWEWRPNECDGVSNHQRIDCLLNRLFSRRSKKTSKLRVTGFCEENSPVTGEFSAQRACNAENVFIWWRHHDAPPLMVLNLPQLKRQT